MIAFLEFLIFVGGLDKQKTPQKRKIPTWWFGHNSKTNPNVKNRNNSMISPINSKVNDIKMSLNVFDLDLHRFSHLSNSSNFFINIFQDCIQPFGLLATYFCDVYLYNSPTFELISRHLEVFCLAQRILLSFLKILLKLA